MFRTAKIIVNVILDQCWFLHQEDIENAYQNAKYEDQRNENNLNDDMEWNLKMLNQNFKKIKQIVLYDIWSLKNENLTKDHSSKSKSKNENQKS